MNFNEENIALFDRYLHGAMSDQEKNDFEQKLETDNELKTEFEAFKSFERIFEDAEITAFKDQLEEWDKSGESPKQGSVFPIRMIATIAAVLLVALLTVTYFFSGSSNAELAENYFEPYDNVLTVRGDKVNMDEGLAYYEQEEYEKAADIFALFSDDPTANFYLAESGMALKHYDDAIAAYNLVLGEESIFEEVAEFHLALAYLGKDDTEKAIKTLEAISNSSSYFEDAERLLDDLK